MNHTLRIYTRTTHGCLEPQLFLSNLLASACLLHTGIRRLIPQQDVHYSMVLEGVSLLSSDHFNKAKSHKDLEEETFLAPEMFKSIETY